MTTPFGRPLLMVATTQTLIAKALSQFARLFLNEHLIHFFPNENSTPLLCIEDLHTRLDSLERHTLFETVCVVDITRDIPNWDIRQSDTGVRTSELILRYPSVYWIFLVEKKHSALNMNRAIQELHFVELSNMFHLITLLKRHANGFRAWFDPTGLRRTVRGEGQDFQYGVAIDDEVDFSVLNGYMLYKNNFSTYVVSTYSEMEKVLNLESENRGGDLSIVMEDIELNFSDHNENDKSILLTSMTNEKTRDLSIFLENRKQKFNSLKDARRIFVSSASETRPMKSPGEFVTKPYGGMYTKELNLLREPHDNRVDKKSCTKTIENGHSVGDSRAQQVAAGILEIAKQATSNVCTTETAIHVALMALDARRLLAGESLSLSLEALALQHKMEVTAECAFIGTASKLAVKDRISSLNEDIKKITRKNKNHSYQTNNALVEIVGNIRQIYKQYDHFFEEEESIIKLRTYEWHLKYWSNQPKSNARRFISNVFFILKLIIAGLPEFYFNYVISRLWKMGLCISIWILIFAVVYSLLFPIDVIRTADYCEIGFHEWLIHSTVNFLAPGTGIGVLADIKAQSFLANCETLTTLNIIEFRRYWYISLTEMLFGFVHIGIFISYLFQKISRR